MSKLSISIIIPVYNVEKYLSQCLDSVLNQTYDNYEVICVNDGSTDGSRELLKKYEQRYSRLRVIDSENGGTASARNIGLREAKGDYIWFVDSDDWVTLGAIQKLTVHLENKPDILNFNGELFYESDGRTEIDEPMQGVEMTGWEYYNKFALQSRKFHFVCVVLRLYKRSFLLDNNLFFEKGISHEDNLWIPIVFYYAKSVHLCSESVYTYRIREGSKMQAPDEIRLLDIVEVANRLASFFIPQKDIEKSVIYRELAGGYFRLFMKDIHQLFPAMDKNLDENIDWENFKTVSVYRRHKFLYSIVKLNPALFRFFTQIELRIKAICK